MIVLGIIEIVFLFFLFAFSHTWLASRKSKLALAEKIGDKIAFFRLFYNISSIIFFVAFLALAPKPDLIVYDLQFPFDLATFALQVLSLIGLIWAAQKIDVLEFIGVKQIERFLNHNFSVKDLDEKQELKIEGAFKFVRHPIYLFSILFIGFRPQMTLFYFVMFLCILIYFYVGSIYEEKKLVEVFGDEYRKYQKEVNGFFPIKIFLKNHD